MEFKIQNSESGILTYKETYEYVISSASERS